MAYPIEQFVKQLESSGIVSRDALRALLPAGAPMPDARQFVKDLIRRDVITKFQAEEVSKGRGKFLVLGNYLLIDRIGAGGMGQVFKALHRRMDRLVAIKLLPPEMTKDDAAIARFQREVKAAARISHPNIVAALDADCAQGIHFLVMELVDGCDLSVLLKRNGPFDVPLALSCIYQAAEGLQAAHAKGIVHRDIKPANLLLSSNGIVKILDMGLARLHEDALLADAALTSSGVIMGTVDYMAPEQALDVRNADARADIYSLGCTLHTIMTGRALYAGDTVLKKVLAHRDSPIPSLRELRPEVPPELDAVVAKMLAKQVEDRYQNMSELLAALGAFTAAPLAVQLRPESASRSALRPGAPAGQADETSKNARAHTLVSAVAARDAWRRRPLLAGIGLLGLVVILATVAMQLRTKPSAQATTPAPPAETASLPTARVAAAPESDQQDPLAGTAPEPRPDEAPAAVASTSAIPELAEEIDRVLRGSSDADVAKHFRKWIAMAFAMRKERQVEKSEQLLAVVLDRLEPLQAMRPEQVALTDTLASALHTLADLHQFGHGNAADSIAYYQRTIALRTPLIGRQEIPVWAWEQLVWSHLNLSIARNATQRHDEAALSLMDAIEQREIFARQHSPHDRHRVLEHDLALQLAQYRASSKVAASAAALGSDLAKAHPEDAACRRIAALGCYFEGRFDESLARAEQAAQLDKHDDPADDLLRALALHKLGRAGDAQRLLGQADEKQARQSSKNLLADQLRSLVQAESLERKVP